MADSIDSELPELAGDDWIKEFSFLFWDVTINNGTPWEFVRTNYDFAGYYQTSTYSKTLWVVLNLASLVLLAIGSVLFIIIGTVEQYEAAEAIGIILLIFAIAYGLLFYQLTYVPPRPRL